MKRFLFYFAVQTDVSYIYSVVDFHIISAEFLFFLQQTEAIFVEFFFGFFEIFCVLVAGVEISHIVSRVKI